MNSSFLDCMACKQISPDVLIFDCCFSIICLKCLDKILKFSDGNNQISCFKCSKKPQITSKKPDSFLREYHNFLGSSLKKSLVASNFCERCESENEDMIYCLDCRKSMCSQCNSNVHGVGRFKLHKRTSATNRNKVMNFKNEPMGDCEIYCLEHSNEVINSVCWKENRLLCNSCLQIHNQTCKAPSIMNLKYLTFKFLGYCFS